MNQDNLSFEEAMKELEKVTGKLEQGQLSLEESIQLFNDGVRLSKFCQDKLNEGKQRIKKLLIQDGEIIEEPFEVKQSEYNKGE